MASSPCAIYLHDRGIKTTGIDALGIGSAHDGIPVHQEAINRGLRTARY